MFAGCLCVVCGGVSVQVPLTLSDYSFLFLLRMLSFLFSLCFLNHVYYF